MSLPTLTFGQKIRSDDNKQDPDRDGIVRIDSTLVTVPTTVLDSAGRYVGKLKKQDFQIFEDGVEQEISLFETSDKPITVLLLLDRSGSMTNHLDKVAQAANAFLSQLNPDDGVTTVTFADNQEVLFQGAKVKDLQKVIKISQHSDDHSTMIYDAVDFALKKIKKVRGRKAIVVFSDGSGSGIFASAKDNLRDAEENEALIYTVQFNTFFKTAPPYLDKKTYFEQVETANKYMHDLARVSGGRHYQIEDISDLGRTFNSIADELRQQYTLGYYPKHKVPGRKQIKVKVNQPDMIVRSRDSYVIKAR